MPEIKTLVHSEGTAVGSATSFEGTATAKSADYTVTDTDNIRTVLMTAGGSNRTVTLPTALDNAGRIITIKKVDSGTGTCIVDGESAETVEGAATLTLAKQYDEVTLQCDGSAWHVIGRDVAAARRGDNTGAAPATGDLGEEFSTTWSESAATSSAAIANAITVATLSSVTPGRYLLTVDASAFISAGSTTLAQVMAEMFVTDGSGAVVARQLFSAYVETDGAVAVTMPVTIASPVRVTSTQNYVLKVACAVASGVGTVKVWGSNAIVSSDLRGGGVFKMTRLS